MIKKTPPSGGRMHEAPKRLPAKKCKGGVLKRVIRQRHRIFQPSYPFGFFNWKFQESRTISESVSSAFQPSSFPASEESA